MNLTNSSVAGQLTTLPYPPLNEVRKTLRLRWYRCPIEQDRLRELSKRSDAQGWLQAGGHFGLYLVLALLSVWAWTAEQWWLLLPAVWATGFVASYFKGTAPHELGHGTVFKTRSLNRFFLYLFSLISWWDPFDYATSHTYHHRYTSHPQADRENVLPLTPSFHPKLLLQLLTVNFFTESWQSFTKGGFLWTVYVTARTALANPVAIEGRPSQEWLRALHQDQPDSFRQSIAWSRWLIAFHLSVFVIALLTGLWVLVLVINLASFVASIGSYLTGLPQHCGLRENVSDFRKSTRSMRLNPVLEFLYWRMNWHTEHHMYANVPCYNLKALAAEIADDMPEPRTLAGAWREMREIWRQQQIDPAYQFDTPVPEPVTQSGKTEAGNSDHELASSIGELAPKGLS